MALGAIGTEIVGHMVGVLGVIVIVLMTGVTGGRGIAIAAGVTLYTLQIDVRSRKRKSGLGMIELGGRPGSGGMAYSAIGVEIIGHMIRILRLIIIVRMAGKTGGRGIAVAAGVATDAIESKMCSGQRELSLAVVKCRRRPGGRGMALSAIGAEIIGDVIGILNLVIIALMAAVTLGRRPGELSSLMA